MRLVKKIYSESPVASFVSREIDKILVHEGLPFYEKMQVEIGQGRTQFLDEVAVLCIDPRNPILLDMDRRAARTLINFELTRLQVKKVIGEVPAPIEDAVICQEMIKNNRGEDLAYMLHLTANNFDVIDIKSYMRSCLPWIVFSGRDEFHENFFRQMVKRRPEYERITGKLFKALKKDLMKGDNVEKAAKLYGDAVYAGDKI